MSISPFKIEDPVTEKEKPSWFFQKWLDLLRIQVNTNIVPTGSAFLTFASTAPDGWVMMDDGTIGSSSSGGTTRADADTFELYKLLWDNVSDTYAAVSSGRDASAIIDFNANKTITLPRQLGRALSVSGAGTSLTSRALGEYLGAETHTLTQAELPSYNLTIPTYDGSSGTGAGRLTESSNGNVNSNVYAIGGSDDPHNIMQPASFWNVMIKL